MARSLPINPPAVPVTVLLLVRCVVVTFNAETSDDTVMAPAVAEPIPGGADGGVLLSVPVSEGMQFHWAGADWQGNTVCSADELGELLSMRLGEIANGIKIDEGLQRIRDAYGRKGYIDLQTSAKATFVKKEATVAYTFTLVEGSAYRMGSLSLRGWPPEDERMLSRAIDNRPPL